MRIAIDIDSTLHHYWPLLSAAAKRRFGVDLPYDRQYTWAISRLREEQLRVCVADTHSKDAIAKAEPYPHAVETVNRWHEQGHFIHVTSHRADESRPAADPLATGVLGAPLAHAREVSDEGVHDGGRRVDALLGEDVDAHAHYSIVVTRS